MANKHLKSIVLEIVDNQLNANDPPITKVTYDRLLDSGYSQQRAKEMIGSVVITEIYDVLKNNELYNEARYTESLNNLK